MQPIQWWPIPPGIAISLSFARAAAAFAVAVLLCAALSAGPGTRPAWGQDGVVLPRGAAVPGFWDPRPRPERPDLSRIQSIRFLTDLDYPPFDFAGTDGNPAGFNVDLARLLC